MKSGICKHWRGLQVVGYGPPSCAVGVNVSDLGNFKQPGAMYRLPCTSMGGTQGHGRAECALAEYPTADEIEADERETKEWIRIVIPVLSDIKATSKPGDSGERECPMCHKRLLWVRASSNGHLHAQCETARCFSIME